MTTACEAAPRISCPGNCQVQPKGAGTEVLHRSATSTEGRSFEQLPRELLHRLEGGHFDGGDVRIVA
jgi:hypothetical protein